MKKKHILQSALLSILSLTALPAQNIPTVVSPPPVPTNNVKITMPIIPSVPVVNAKVPKLILLDSNGKLIEKDSMDKYYPSKKKIIFSDHVAPPRFNVDRGHRKEVKSLVGDIKNSRVPAYLHTVIMSIDEAKEKLQSAGFKILSTFEVDKKGVATTIVFTNEAIIKAASITNRGFAGTLRLTVDTKNKLIVISNPIYLMKAFMQKEYNQELAQNTLTQLRNAFKGVRNSEELVKFRVLERFHFMENMPYYQDMKMVAEGTNAELLAKAKKSKNFVFEQKLDNGSYIVGIKLGKRTRKFIKKIGYENSGLLPYPVLIENGQAIMLAPQYYIAVMYPMLKMSQFMKIATVPGAIGKDIDRIFR